MIGWLGQTLVHGHGEKVPWFESFGQQAGRDRLLR